METNKLAMTPISNAFRKIKTLEKIFLCLTLLTVILKFLFRYTVTTEILMSSLILGVLYFPLGFMYIGKPSINRSYIVSIILGFVYAIGVVTLIYGAAGIEGFDIPLYVAFFFLSLVVIFLLFKLKSYDKEYIYSQFIRIGFIVVGNLIVLIFSSQR